ncbi:MAG: hypothetical protein AVDCRST_MAG43-2044, partial [uncultured Thermomicrobiales bacterium]
GQYHSRDRRCPGRSIGASPTHSQVLANQARARADGACIALHQPLDHRLFGVHGL